MKLRDRCAWHIHATQNAIKLAVNGLRPPQRMRPATAALPPPKGRGMYGPAQPCELQLTAARNGLVGRPSVDKVGRSVGKCETESTAGRRGYKRLARASLRTGHSINKAPI